MTKVEQEKMLADIKACRKQIFKLCNQYNRLAKADKIKPSKEAVRLRKQIAGLERFLEKVQATALI